MATAGEILTALRTETQGSNIAWTRIDPSDREAPYDYQCSIAGYTLNLTGGDTITVLIGGQKIMSSNAAGVANLYSDVETHYTKNKQTLLDALASALGLE